jgi:hypothetical protein
MVDSSTWEEAIVYLEKHGSTGCKPALGWAKAMLVTLNIAPNIVLKKRNRLKLREVLAEIQGAREDCERSQSLW